MLQRKIIPDFDEIIQSYSETKTSQNDLQPPVREEKEDDIIPEEVTPEEMTKSETPIIGNTFTFDTFTDACRKSEITYILMESNATLFYGESLVAGFEKTANFETTEYG